MNAAEIRTAWSEFQAQYPDDAQAIKAEFADRACSPKAGAWLVTGSAAQSPMSWANRSML